MYVLYSVTNDGIHTQWLPTEEECLKFVQSAQVKHYKCLPASRQKNMCFSAAFEWDSVKKDVVVNMEKAKEMKKNELRVIRESLWEKVNTAALLALVSGDDEKASVAASLKQQLKDITLLEFPNSEDALAAFYPEVFQAVRDLRLS